MTNDSNTYRTVTPYLVVEDADAEIKFLKSAFGANEALCERNADKTVKHAEIQVGDSLIMLGQASAAWKALKAAFYLRLRQGARRRRRVTIRARGQTLRTSERGRRGSERHHVVDWLADQMKGNSGGSRTCKPNSPGCVANRQLI